MTEPFEDLSAADRQLVSRLRRDVLAALGAGTALGLLPRTAAAQAAQPPDPLVHGALKHWPEYVRQLEPAGDLIDMTWEPGSEQLRAELYRQLVMNIAQGYIWYFQSTPDHPDWMPFENSIFVLQPNPDAVYHLAPVSGQGVYRVSGFRGSNRVMGFAVGRGMLGTAEPQPGFNNYDADGLTLGTDGAFDVVFSTERPKDWTGDWRYLHPEAGSILIRQFSYDWGVEQEARFAIERLDRAPLKPRQPKEEIGARLDLLLGGFVRRMSRICIGVDNAVAQRLGLNVMELSGFEDLGNSGEWPQKYWRCIYDYQPGEALIIETGLPRQCKYWNVQLNDALWNQIEFGYRQSSLNGHQARLDADGRFRAVIALEDPGVPNWLDSGGYLRGMLVGRWNGADSHPLPTIRKVPLGEIRRHLPADTPQVSPQDREAVLRARNRGLQMRRRW
ncbi:MAG: hypothetical protein AB7Q97_00445 [Gammaproteobacteria bacterium]